jgi:hypothetical protein
MFFILRMGPASRNEDQSGPRVMRSVAAFAQRASMGLYWQSSHPLETEYDLGHAMVANVGYEGSVGRHLLYNL